MATQSIVTDTTAGAIPLGLVAVAVPGTPVGLGSIYSPTGVGVVNLRAKQIILQGYKAAVNGLQNNAGLVYILLRGVQGAGNRSDYGAMICAVGIAQTIVLASPIISSPGFSIASYFVDADNAADSVLVSVVPV